MDTKKVQPQAAHHAPVTAAPSAFTWKKVGAYFADLKAEFYKITWTSRDELKTYTLVVVAATFILGFAVYMTDVAIQGALAMVDMIVRVIFG